MGALGRLLGKEPPRVPAGGRAFVWMDAPDGSRWSVRVQMPGEDPTTRCRKLSPSFDQQTSAYAYLDWVNGGAAFDYPAGAA